jgi:uncharacterized protein
MNSFSLLTQQVFILFIYINISLCAQTENNTSYNINNERQITVTGEGEVKVVPNMISFIIGVENTNKNPDQAKQENDYKMQKINDIIKEFKIPSRDIQTEVIDLYPVTNDQREEKIIGYRIRNNISISLYDISIFEKLLLKLVNIGISNISGVSEGVSDPRKYKDEARKLALVAAKEKAIDMLTIYGQKIGKVLNIIENTDFRHNSIPNGSAISIPDNFSHGFSTAYLGQNSIKASVTVTFEIVDK